MRGDPGHEGHRGIPGPPGVSDPDAFERNVAEVTGRSLAANQEARDAEKQKKRDTSNQLAVIALFIVFAIGLFFFLDDRADDRFAEEQQMVNVRIDNLTRSLVEVCQNNAVGNVRQNQALETLRVESLAEARSPQERDRINMRFDGLLAPISECPP